MSDADFEFFRRLGEYGSKQFIDTWNKYVNEPLDRFFKYYGDYTPDTYQQYQDQQKLRDWDLTGLYGRYLDNETRKAQMQDQMAASNLSFNEIKYIWGSSLTQGTKSSGLGASAFREVSSNITRLYK